MHDLAYRRASAARHAVFAASIVLAPLLLLVGTALNPGIGGIGQGARNLAANATADPVANELHLATFFALSFVLPVSALGLAALAITR